MLFWALEVRLGIRVALLMERLNLLAILERKDEGRWAGGESASCGKAVIGDGAIAS